MTPLLMHGGGGAKPMFPKIPNQNIKAFQKSCPREEQKIGKTFVCTPPDIENRIKKPFQVHHCYTTINYKRNSEGMLRPWLNLI